jgi:hypothetical protein
MQQLFHIGPKTHVALKRIHASRTPVYFVPHPYWARGLFPAPSFFQDNLAVGMSVLQCSHVVPGIECTIIRPLIGADDVAVLMRRKATIKSFRLHSGDTAVIRQRRQMLYGLMRTRSDRYTQCWCGMIKNVDEASLQNRKRRFDTLTPSLWPWRPHWWRHAAALPSNVAVSTQHLSTDNNNDAAPRVAC